MNTKIKATNDKITIVLLKSKRQKLLDKPDKNDVDRLELERIEQKLRRLDND